ncbi:exosortase F system-associated protein [Yeosuana sp. MJ-SS3]|jgi:exosortase F-associated protein|uniref:Exosortase F system-associated protein n=1 Tax=Gilvirhabdus luticola TaxID=3079858 RepID=A0ABU3U5R5_9FLAO|nr:exosortase F system-associated protein [Yeosuana sp. MJ-SS3]MDU8885754.1 exosortase F system-associated protein [Yeosuana sp. MJ-SS3]
MKNYLKYPLLIFLVGLLVLIRIFENDLFYDPYLLFFQNDYLYIDSPRREVFKLTLFTSLRYLMNTLISLAIMFVVFKDKNIIKFSAIIYTFSFIVLILLFLYFVTDPKREQYYLFFNIRRFLIQPIILLLLLPAFYYNKLKQ